MKRVSVALTQRSYDFLRREARRCRVGMAAVIRAMLEESMEARHRIPRGHPFRKIIGIGRGNGSPVSENHDQHLYGWRARKR